MRKSSCSVWGCEGREGGSGGSPAVAARAAGRGREGGGVSPVRATHLRPLGLDAAEAVGPVDDGVFGDHLVGVDVTAGPDDAAARQDHVPADKGCRKEREGEAPVRVTVTQGAARACSTSCSAPGASPAQPGCHQRGVPGESHSCVTSCSRTPPRNSPPLPAPKSGTSQGTRRRPETDLWIR